MSTFGLELSDVSFLTARCTGDDCHLVDVADRNGSPDWPGYCHADGANLSFGRLAEDLWFVHPRRIVHNFWARLGHEPSTLAVSSKPPSSSELAFFFLREFVGRLHHAAGSPEKVVLAIPGAYLKDPATEEEKVGLLLGMAAELKLPLAGLVDLACAALCDPRSPGFNPNLPVLVVDSGLEGTDLTLFSTRGRVARRDFLHLPQHGVAPLLKQLTSSFGNRFLRHTAFDILEDGRIEQTFFRQTKDFLFGEAGEFRFVINTATRTYEMVAKREQLAADAAPFVGAIVQNLQSFQHASPHAADPCTIALTHRAACLPGLEARLRAAGCTRLLRLPRGAPAVGAARIGHLRLPVLRDLADAAVETAVELAEARTLIAAPWEARLQKHRGGTTHQRPTHAILDGVGQPIDRNARFVIGLAETAPDLALPAAFGAADNCTITLSRDDGRWWFVDDAAAREGATHPGLSLRSPVEAGDRLVIRSGEHTAEILFAHCPARRD
ncbi:MAG: hypothetical protein HZC55_25885 [Verrucomicrobia bacterium]|nr:hypothetical protein [Verrucomicrobiota bacterium]